MRKKPIASPTEDVFERRVSLQVKITTTSNDLLFVSVTQISADLH